MTRDQILEVAHHFDRLLARNGFIPQRASEVILMDWKEPKKIGDHVRFMLRELSHLSTDRAQRWLSFAEGVIWSLGIVTILEITEMNKPEADLETL